MRGVQSVGAWVAEPWRGQSHLIPYIGLKLILTPPVYALLHETSKPQIDELADWQLRILSEYSQAGTSLMEQAETIWLPWLAGGLGGSYWGDS